MAKQKPNKQHPLQRPKQQSVPAGSSTFGYLLRNLAVIAGISFLFWLVWQKFSNERKLNELTEEFYSVKAHNPRSPELQTLYDEIIPLQQDVMTDTGFLTRITRGYHWAIHDMCLGNLDNIEKVKEDISKNHEDSTEQAYLEARMKRKIGLYTFFEYINKNTPKDAVLFLPNDTSITNNSKWNFISEPQWTEAFIYPRLCLQIGTEKEYPELAKRANYVVIVNGIGYDKLKYTVSGANRVPEAVLPIDHPPGPANTTQ